MKRTDELSKFDICCISQIYAKYFLILVVLVSMLLSMTPVSAITVDGYKSTNGTRVGFMGRSMPAIILQTGLW